LKEEIEKLRMIDEENARIAAEKAEK